MEQVLFGGFYHKLYNAATAYNTLVGGDNWFGSDTLVYKPVSTDGVIKYLRVKLSGAPGVGKKYTFALMLNGNPTALTLEIADGATTGSNMVNEIIVTAGDTVSLRCIPNGTPTQVYATWTSMFEGDNPNESLILGGGAQTLSSAGIRYCQVMCAYAVYTAVENDHREVMPTAGTIKDLYVQLDADPGNAPDAYRFTLRLNGATVAQSLIVTITADDTTGSDLVHNLAVVAGDVLTMMIEPLNGPAVEPRAHWGMTFVADIDGESVVLSGISNDLDDTLTEYNNVTGVRINWWTAIEGGRYQLGQICVLKKLHVLLSAPPGAGNDRDFAIRIAGTNVITLQISDAATTGDSGALEDTVVNDDYLTIRTIPTDTPDVADAYWGFVCCAPYFWTDKISGVIGVAKINGIAEAAIRKINNIYVAEPV